MAGELIGVVSMAMHGGLTLGQLGDSIVPYPTRIDILRKLGGAYTRTRLTPGVKNKLTTLLKWRR